MVVWKYVLARILNNLQDKQVVEMPTRARMLTVQMQGDSLCLWALVDPKAPKAPYAFRIAGTGHIIEEANLLYIGTVLILDDTIALHIFQCDL